MYGCSKKSVQEQNPADYIDLFDTMPSFSSNTEEEVFGEKLDLDLTKMSATMVYSQVFNMLLVPDEFNGKLIKVAGMFSEFVPNGKSEKVMTIIVSDALACCQQGLEFKISDDSPLKNQSLPASGSEVEIIGRFILGKTQEGFDFFYLDCKSMAEI